MQAIIPGGPAAMVSALFERHAEQVQRVIVAGLRPGDAGVAEDLAQDVWLSFWEHVTSGHLVSASTVTSPAGLLFTLARHKVADRYRSRVRRETARDMDRFASTEAVAA